jgi:hypothetical protein
LAGRFGHSFAGAEDDRFAALLDVLDVALAGQRVQA